MLCAAASECSFPEYGWVRKEMGCFGQGLEQCHAYSIGTKMLKRFVWLCRETDVQALQQRCRQLLRQRDADRLTRRQDMHRLERLEAQVESLGE